MINKKKVLHKRMHNKERRTIEAYACTCWCQSVDCNPCSIIPADAYIARRNTLNGQRNYNTFLPYYLYG